MLTYFTERQEVSIWTLGGRERMEYQVREYHRELLKYQQGESDLIYRKGEFYLLPTCDVPEEDEQAVDEWLGVDRGINETASDSDGRQWSGKEIDEKREWYAQRKAALQSVGTRSAKRRLQQLSGRQARFQRDVNHQISKKLVARAQGTNRGIALEDLSGISDGTTVRHSQRARHSNWSRFQLKQFIVYKAALSGVPVKFVSPAYTSQTCSGCGHCEKANRKGSGFCCRECGQTMDADINAAVNIAARAISTGPT